MIRTQTLIVFNSSRDPAIADDHIQALRWACQEDCHVVFVDDRQALPAGERDGWSVHHTKLPLLPELAGFRRMAVLQEVINIGTSFQCAWLLSDDTLPIRPGLDRVILQTMREQNAGLLGVADRHDYNDAFVFCTSLFAEWGLPFERWQTGTAVPIDGFVVLSQALVLALFRKQLLVPEGIERWSLPWGVYISWVSQLLGYYQHLQGSVDRPVPPIYADVTPGCRLSPPPHILSDEFLLYHSLRQVRGFNEEEIRLGYRKLRAGRSRESLQ